MDNPQTEKERTMPNISLMAPTPEVQHEQLAALKELLISRIAAVEDGIEVAHEDFVRFPTEVDKRIAATEKLFQEKIDRVFEVYKLEIRHLQERNEWNERLRLEQKSDQATNLAAALSSAKELVSVNGLNTTKQIDALALLVNTLGNSLNDKITDVKDRVTAREGKGLGMSALWAVLVGAAILVIGILNYLK